MPGKFEFWAGTNRNRLRNKFIFKFITFLLRLVPGDPKLKATGII